MTQLLTAAQMRAIEQAAIDSGEVTGLELMERAGRGVVDAILDWRPELSTAPHRAVVLCGPGNNGGDGFVVARMLHQRGWEVEVLLYGDETRLPPDAAKNAQRWREIGSTSPVALDESNESIVSVSSALEASDLVVDAIFGTGLTRGFKPPQSINHFFHLKMRDGFWSNGVASRPYIVAVDTPSELDANSGVILDHDGVYGGEMGSHLTVTFHRAKIGHHLIKGPLYCGDLRVVDIGLNDLWPPSDVHSVRLTSNTGDSFVPNGHLAKARHSLSSHKYLFGHALILSGGVGKGGAARLAARGALRIGAGLVTVGCPPSAVIENAARLDAIMVASLKDAEALTNEITDRKIKAICIGPGFGAGERLRAFVEAGLKPGLPMVLDADALTDYRDDPAALFDLLHKDCVITPHEGEFGRLFPDILAKLKEPATTGPAYSKVDATREAAKRAGCAVLFKGPDTVIAEPSGHCVINSAHYNRAVPWLATAGSGDVLAGFITGLLARGLAPMQAAETAAWLHVECALKFGPGLIAEDIPEQLPAVFRDLGL